MLGRHSGRSIAIVGGAGFIGHHVALALRSEGAEVNIIDHLQVNNLLSFIAGPPSTEGRDLYLKMLLERLKLLQSNGIRLHTQDARDNSQLAAVLNQIGPQVLVHLSAISNARECDKVPQRAIDHGLRTLVNSMEWARGRVEQFVFFSSSMVYGNFCSLSIDESHPLAPLGIYGSLKQAGEMMVRSYGKVFGLPYTIIRPSALYGPRCVSRRVVQQFIEAALDRRFAVVEGDLSTSLDFTYIDDLAQGLSRVIGQPKALGEAFNMTFGQARSLGDLVDLIRQYLPTLRLQHRESDPTRPIRGTLSVEKARRLIGYQPAVPLEKGIEKYVEWYRTAVAEQGNRSAPDSAAISPGLHRTSGLLTEVLVEASRASQGGNKD